MFMLYLIHGSVADQKTDAIVNAANRALAGGCPYSSVKP